MARTVFYTATTLDGFIATDDHSLDWLITRDVGKDGPLDYAVFIAGVGSLCMGAQTYEWVYRACGRPTAQPSRSAGRRAPRFPRYRT